MKYANIQLGSDVEIDPSSSVNNVTIGDRVKIARRCSLFGSESFALTIGHDSYVGMNTIINGFHARVMIGAHVSIAQNVNIMADSGPNASKKMQALFPLKTGPVSIGDHTWIGANVVILPGVTIGKCCIIGANTLVTESFPDYSVIGGSPAKLLRRFNEQEIQKLEQHD